MSDGAGPRAVRGRRPATGRRRQPGSLQGARVLVTGASSGIGAATAALLAHRGARVAAAGRGADVLDAMVRDGRAAAAVAGDLTAPGAPGDVVARSVAALGGLD
ncbi:MAG TPA: SDR family NAD(P)-dependent oxidoreductase, partial [Acidimicrobiales bacterium]|nr:SDR family NAD(P)-dependent oxidoreductase [Acidimicrobiales bacterium]